MDTPILNSLNQTKTFQSIQEEDEELNSDDDELDCEEEDENNRSLDKSERKRDNHILVLSANNSEHGPGRTDSVSPFFSGVSPSGNNKKDLMFSPFIKPTKPKTMAKLDPLLYDASQGVKHTEGDNVKSGQQTSILYNIEEDKIENENSLPKDKGSEDNNNNNNKDINNGKGILNKKNEVIPVVSKTKKTKKKNLLLNLEGNIKRDEIKQTLDSNRSEMREKDNSESEGFIDTNRSNVSRKEEPLLSNRSNVSERSEKRKSQTRSLF